MGRRTHKVRWVDRRIEIHSGIAKIDLVANADRSLSLRRAVYSLHSMRIYLLTKVYPILNRGMQPRNV